MSWYFRVSPHLTLQDLREHLSEFLGEEAVAEKFLFLKCIGNNLTVVSFINFPFDYRKAYLNKFSFLNAYPTQLLNILCNMYVISIITKWKYHLAHRSSEKMGLSGILLCTKIWQGSGGWGLVCKFPWGEKKDKI